MAYQEDKFENFLAKLPIGREARAKFADFTVEAVAAPGVDPLISGHLTGLKTARNTYREEIVERVGAGGSSETGTATEQEVFTLFKTFIQGYDTDGMQPYLRRKPAAEATFYPNKLSGLTQAPKSKRLSRLTAYTQALEATPALPLVPVPDGAPAGTTPQAPGIVARALLTAYEAASKQKTTSRTTLKDAITDLTPAALALGEALWDVHTAALYVHRRTPKEARKYFDYAGLPHRVTKPARKSTAKKTA